MKALGLTQPPAQGLRGFWDTLDTIKTKATDIYNQNADTLDKIRDQAVSDALKSTSSTPGSTLPATTGINQNPGNYTPDSIGGGMSTGVKVAIGAGALALVGGIIYMVTGKKKKSLGGGSSGVADDNKATSTVFNGPKRKSKKRKK